MAGNVIKPTGAYKAFTIFNYGLLITAALLCVLPMINILAISFSSNSKASAGMVGLWPVGFNTKSYEFVMRDKLFWTCMINSLKRILLGSSFNLVLSLLGAYALSKDSRTFPKRKLYVWFIFFTMLFSGGLIPGFLTVYYTGLMNSVWALVIPSAVSPFFIILMLNFFRQLPKELEEAAFMDGAGHMRILWQIFIPISKPVIATVLLFSMVNHWNSWFDGVLFMNRRQNYPLQTFLQSIINSDPTKYLTPEEKQKMQMISPKTLRAAQIFIAAIPILAVYPFLQKYFTKGMILGSVKG